MSSSYQEFAHIYDELMNDIPYDAYIDLLDLASTGVVGKKVLDIGCGTGLLSAMLSKKGASVTGVDLSADMLEVASNRARSLGLDIEFIQQPMQQLEVEDTYDIAVISIDSLNYVISQTDVRETFRRIYKALGKDGVLLFDVHSIFKMDEIFLEGPFVFDDQRITYMWQTAPGDEEHSIYSQLAFFVRQENGLFKRFDEVHMQRTFSVTEYVGMLNDAGFQIERIFADWEDEPPTDESERVFFQVRK
ncbi:class I SAM-dependent DNA methyltransferase [Sporosarcina aquimarina]|uniref:class I SAM-dependent DNA methyltransferase n=1 Tax=Sporosarcina aquimarina TaxID=114975 RepID=UPI001C8D9CF6|nr:class I SAM-dependent methyltransferase [Sporosarcina aquimarina]MBY0220985.1 class I SAM-dependent methyltransferase [Sporosarcina aquimarina]